MGRTRAYDMTERTRRAKATTRAIVDATEQLLATGPVGAVTLQAIADGAGVTVQTVLRHMGSRDGCLDAVRDRVVARVQRQRGSSAPGDVDAAVADLIAHYEAEGRLVINLLAQEDTEAIAREASEAGRAYHRAWVERCFGPLLTEPDRDAVDALVAATDLYVWKLLRLDLGRSRHEAQAVVLRLARAVVESS